MAASRTFQAGNINPLEASLAETAIGRSPRIGGTPPSSERPPTIVNRRSSRCGNAPDAARIPSAIGKSNAAPTLRTSAGARLTVMRSAGNGKPEFRIAVRTRSRLSRTVASGNPTIVIPGNPGETSTSTETGTASTPNTAAAHKRASTRMSLAISGPAKCGPDRRVRTEGTQVRPPGARSLRHVPARFGHVVLFALRSAAIVAEPTIFLTQFAPPVDVSLTSGVPRTWAAKVFDRLRTIGQERRMTERPLDGSVALVTGASRGVGRGIAVALARAGCRVAVNHRSAADADEAAAAVAELAAFGVESMAVQADVCRARDVREMVDAVLERFGGLNVLVNNAGIQTWSPLLDLLESDWDRVIDTNLKGCFLCTQSAGRHMRDHGGGSIINIGSGCNKMAFANLAAYTASKGGIEMLTKVAAVELGPFGIRVNCVAPGAIEVERTKSELPDYAGQWGRVTPLRRIGLPDDVGRVVTWLATSEASFVSGQTVWVDGGLFAQPPWPQGS